MKGDMDRDCRAMGGVTEGSIKENVKREFHGAQPKNTPDGTLKRAKGGAVNEFSGETHNADEGGEKRKRGGKVEGKAMKMHMGRANRARGGGVGADRHPVTHDGGMKPKGRMIMPEEEQKP